MAKAATDVYSVSHLAQVVFAAYTYLSQREVQNQLAAACARSTDHKLP